MGADLRPGSLSEFNEGQETSLAYYLKIDGLTGDSTDNAHPGSQGWFVVDSFDICATALTSGAGGGARRAQFSPLSVDIHSLAGLAPLLADEVEGKALKNGRTGRGRDGGERGQEHDPDGL